MKISHSAKLHDSRKNFTVLFVLVILVVIGTALIPLVDVADNPRPRQGNTLTVSFSWSGASAKVVEQNVTSRIEGLVSAVKGVESISSESNFGSGRVVVRLKKNADVSSTKFEIASLLKQVQKKLPEGVSYPVLDGGDVVNGEQKKETVKQLLSYQVNSDMSDEQLKDYLARKVEPELQKLSGVKGVHITGGTSKYIEITYDPFILATYGLSAGDIEAAIKSFIGRQDIVGEVQREDAGGHRERLALYLATGKFHKPLEEMPIKNIAGKTVYLNDLATYEYKDREPGSFYRINGMNTIYLNIFVDAGGNLIKMSSDIREKVTEISKTLKKGVYFTLTHDEAEEKESELHKLVWRSLMSLAILMLFLWLAHRDWRYLLIMGITLAANLLVSVIAYWMFDIRLHIYSLAGITVSMGLIIDASVVMVDHYSYYRNRKMFLAILAALLTTIGSLIVVFWLPEYLQRDLWDFSWIIIINLTVSLLVAYFFVPALVEQFHYCSRQQGKVRHQRFLVWWKRIYTRYVMFVQKRKWVYVVLLILAFGIPFHLLPDTLYDVERHQQITANGEDKEIWYEKLYNSTLGSKFFLAECKKPLTRIFGGTMRLFTESLSRQTYSDEGDDEKILCIRAKMPLGGTAAQLNEKVLLVDQFLSRFKEIERFETRVEAWGATTEVKFRKEYRDTSFPYVLENKVIGRIISIGGAEWSTSGVSKKGFSNSISLQYRFNTIEVAGYNYDRLYRIAEDICAELKKNSRVTDIIIQTPDHKNQEDEYFARYDQKAVALYGFDIPATHNALKGILSGYDIDRYEDMNVSTPMYLKSRGQDAFALWHVLNSYLRVDGTDTKMSDFMSIERREAKNCIPKENQSYKLHVSFNVMGSPNYVFKYIDSVKDKFNSKIPVGFKCQNASHGYYEDDGTQYWLIGLIAVIIFFICSILFESLYVAFAIVMLIPVSFIGTFLTYWFTGVEFGTGGYASMVMLAGLTVNAGIYIMHEYLSYGRRGIRQYVKAYNHKIIAVFLTIVSTVLSLIPFIVIDGKSEPFWYSFAVGTMGGMLFSLLTLIFVMPIMIRNKKPYTLK